MDVVLVLVGVVLAFYVILLRPVMKQQRQRREDISSLRVGDEVLTSGGFYAIVRDIRTTDSGPMEIDLEAAPGVTLRAAPHAVEQVTKHAPEEVVVPAQTEESGGTEEPASKDANGEPSESADSVRGGASR